MVPVVSRNSITLKTQVFAESFGRTAAVATSATVVLPIRRGSIAPANILRENGKKSEALVARLANSTDQDGVTLERQRRSTKAKAHKAPPINARDRSFQVGEGLMRFAVQRTILCRLIKTAHSHISDCRWRNPMEVSTSQIVEALLASLARRPRQGLDIDKPLFSTTSTGYDGRPATRPAVRETAS
jgi:hypothetical protein